MSSPADLGDREARRLITQKRLTPSSSPTRIARVEAVEPAVNAVVARDVHRLLDAARAAEEEVVAGRSAPSTASRSPSRT